MTVQELIDALKSHDPKTLVVVEDAEYAVPIDGVNGDTTVDGTVVLAIQFGNTTPLKFPIS